ncbi:unnamed protein product [Linum trigynum]|uniref:Uncharacterized protein n=1 Tax=Linum trigynum TaxID=586398 RepID=A0AAV2D4K6_9ROSI
MGRIPRQINNGGQSNSPSFRVSSEAQKINRSFADDDCSDSFYPETQQIWEKLQRSGGDGRSNIDRRLSRSRTKKKNQVLLEGYVDLSRTSCSGAADDDLKRAKSLTDDDLDELKGCLDLGFGGFSYDEIPELCNTLPALELCYSMSQKFLDDTNQKSSFPAEGMDSSSDGSPADGVAASDQAASSPIANWKISSPGDHPEDVKARLKYWAQAVACTVKLCS